MPYSAFYELFPEVAERETRSIILQKSKDADPKYINLNGEYSFIEAYCDEKDCDCRRVFFNVVSPTSKGPLAVVAYGWESKKYYSKWMGESDESVISTLFGASLNLASPQSSVAPQLLELVKDVLLNDTAYVERIKRHYKMYRQRIDEKYLARPITRPTIKISRNDLCVCGSGKKYKKCCGGVLSLAH